MPKGIKQSKIDRQAAEIAKARSEFFSGVTKSEAAEVFKLLSILSTFPGATPPEPLSGCEVIWSSTLKVGESLDRQVFDVRVVYRNLLFRCLSNGECVIQLSNSTLMNFDNWDLEEEQLFKRVLEKLVQEDKLSKRKTNSAVSSK